MRSNRDIPAAVSVACLCLWLWPQLGFAEVGKSPTADAPILFTAPTGDLVQGGSFYPRVGVDTDSQFIGSVFYGLGDVADLGFTSTPYVRYEPPGEDTAVGFLGYPMMVGRLGVRRGLLWRWQPSVSVGVCKSFDVKAFERETNLSEWFVAITSHTGDRLSLTLGVAKWDGATTLDIRGEDATWALDEEKTYLERIRPFGGVEVLLTPGHYLLAEWYYMPEFEFAVPPAPPNIELDGTTSLGIRSHLSEWLTLDAGVRGPDVSNLHQIDLELFVQASAYLPGAR